MWRSSSLFALALATFACADNVVFKDCGSKTGKINTVDVTPCPAEPCPLKKGTTVTTRVNFTSNVDSVVGKTVVHGLINGILVPYPVPVGAFTPPLPLKQGINVVYNNSISVASSDPKISLVVKWEVKDNNGDDLFCFVVPCNIVD